jgi:hypothetical protein
MDKKAMYDELIAISEKVTYLAGLTTYIPETELDLHTTYIETMEDALKQHKEILHDCLNRLNDVGYRIEYHMRNKMTILKYRREE